MSIDAAARAIGQPNPRPSTHPIQNPIPNPIPNPIVLQRADPCVLRHEGHYYFTGSHPLYDRIVLRKAERLEDLQDAPEVAVWTRHDSGPQSGLIWAPELHRVNDAWYLYYAASPDGAPSADRPGAAETFNHRNYVLECTDPDPMTGSWVERGQIDTGWESFALDATSFVVGGVQYLVWAQQDLAIPGNSNLYIARMENPWTLASEAVLLSRPEFEWETRVFAVNEGPSVLVRDGRLYLTYSASGTGIEYAMGLLTADVDADLLDPASWVKSPVPVFVSEPDVGIYGPGHNSFTQTPDGETVLVFHARTYTEIVGDPLWEPNRHACAQVLPFDESGDPQWGRPLPLTRPVPTSIDVLP
ncbi:extracellular exo-alpha-(1-_5)-L-arabinofuranosidase [Demequina sediminis]|uniref:Extracellular exo-alpha-(1->5)-L-arabinofuranosidase n=1 Tax=Demequina sediminis TaxID=1930058 RepID=A0ABP9WJX4_9MICO|nr:family 43 glycosylhydrolase [Demequina sediminis]BDZ62065.1 alpha-N-arabinofuranosidase [Demequina sediminis]